MDLTLGDDTEIVNKICIMVVTQGDGTPLCPTSFKEEDVVELGAGVGSGVPRGCAVALRC